MNNDNKTDTPKEQPTESPKTTPKGGRNLLFLGIGATVIAFLTTFVSLKIYHDSGDIYLDRSRPGFLPEQEEVEEKDETDDYKLPDSGTLTKEILDEYLQNLKKEINRLNDFSDDPFGEKPLTDETLGF